jgi:hypothetical protein
MTALRAIGKISIVMSIVIAAAIVTSPWWTVEIARGLVCAQEVRPSDALLVENFDPDYVLFEQAAGLEAAGFARIALVPVEAFPDPSTANPVSAGIAEVMARQARLRSWQAVPIVHIEPISLNAAIQMRARLRTERVASVIVVAPAFRSRRSSLVYRAIFGAAGVTVYCFPVFRQITPERWTQTWHGIQEVTEEFIKLQYYRFYVLPFLARGAGRG